MNWKYIAIAIIVMRLIELVAYAFIVGMNVMTIPTVIVDGNFNTILAIGAVANVNVNDILPGV